MKNNKNLIMIVIIFLLVWAGCSGPTEPPTSSPPTSKKLLVYIYSPYKGEKIRQTGWPNTAVSLKGEVFFDGKEIKDTNFISWRENSKVLGRGSNVIYLFSNGQHTVWFVYKDNTKADSMSCTFIITAAPLITISVMTADKKNSDNLCVYFYNTKGKPIDSLAMTSNPISISTKATLEDSIIVVIDVINGFLRSYCPSLAILTEEDIEKEQKFVLVPFKWDIKNGTFAGRTTDIDIIKAYALDELGFDAPISFFQRNTDKNTGTIKYWSAFWKKNSFPVPVAFDRQVQNVPVDSIGLWKYLQEFEDEMGMGDIVRPAKLSETISGNILKGIRIKLTNEFPIFAVNDGVNYFDWTLSSSYISFGPKEFWTINSEYVAAGFPAMLKHEMGHAFGIGHTTAWPTMMGRNEDKKFSATDVGYIQLYYAVAELKLNSGAKWGLSSAHQGVRFRMLGLKLEKISVW